MVWFKGLPTVDSPLRISKLWGAFGVFRLEEQPQKTPWAELEEWAAGRREGCGRDADVRQISARVSGKEIQSGNRLQPSFSVGCMGKHTLPGPTRLSQVLYWFAAVRVWDRRLLSQRAGSLFFSLCFCLANFPDRPIPSRNAEVFQACLNLLDGLLQTSAAHLAPQMCLWDFGTCLAG